MCQTSAEVFRCRSSSILPFGSTKHLQNIRINYPLASRYWPATITTVSFGILEPGWAATKRTCFRQPWMLLQCVHACLAMSYASTLHVWMCPPITRLPSLGAAPCTHCHVSTIGSFSLCAWHPSVERLWRRRQAEPTKRQSNQKRSNCDTVKTSAFLLWKLAAIEWCCGHFFHWLWEEQSLANLGSLVRAAHRKHVSLPESAAGCEKFIGRDLGRSGWK